MERRAAEADFERRLNQKIGHGELPWEHKKTDMSRFADTIGLNILANLQFQPIYSTSDLVLFV
jgi:hypothetical protein